MTNTMPTARMPVIAVCRSRLETLRGLSQAPSVVQVKNRAITRMAPSITSTCRLGSENLPGDGAPGSVP